MRITNYDPEKLFAAYEQLLEKVKQNPYKTNYTSRISCYATSDDQYNGWVQLFELYTPIDAPYLNILNRKVNGGNEIHTIQSVIQVTPWLKKHDVQWDHLTVEDFRIFLFEMSLE